MKIPVLILFLLKIRQIFTAPIDTGTNSERSCAKSYEQSIPVNSTTLLILSSEFKLKFHRDEKFLKINDITKGSRESFTSKLSIENFEEVMMKIKNSKDVRIFSQGSRNKNLPMAFLGHRKYWLPENFIQLLQCPDIMELCHCDENNCQMKREYNDEYIKECIEPSITIPPTTETTTTSSSIILSSTISIDNDHYITVTNDTYNEPIILESSETIPSSRTFIAEIFLALTILCSIFLAGFVWKYKKQLDDYNDNDFTCQALTNHEVVSALLGPVSGTLSSRHNDTLRIKHRSNELLCTVGVQTENKNRQYDIPNSFDLAPLDSTHFTPGYMSTPEIGNIESQFFKLRPSLSCSNIDVELNCYRSSTPLSINQAKNWEVVKSSTSLAEINQNTFDQESISQQKKNLEYLNIEESIAKPSTLERIMEISEVHSDGDQIYITTNKFNNNDPFVYVFNGNSLTHDNEETMPCFT